MCDDSPSAGAGRVLCLVVTVPARSSRQSDSSIRRLLREAGGLTWLFAIAALCAIAVSITTVALADIMGRALSAIVRGASFESTWSVIRLGIVLGMVAVFAVFTRKLLSSQFSERLQARLRERIVVRLTHATAGAMHTRHSGDVISRMSSDMVLMEQLLKNDALQFVVQTLTAVLAAAYMLTHNWFLTLVSIAGTPVLLLVSSALTKPLSPLNTASQTALGQASVTAQEAMAGAEVVRALNMTGVLSQRHEHSLDQWLNHSIAAGRQVAKLYSAGTALSLTPFVVVFSVGGYMALTGHLEFGLLIAFVQLMNYLSFPVQEMPRLLGQMKTEVAAAKRVLELLDLPVERPGGDLGSMDTDPLIELANVSFTYPGTQEPQLQGVSLQVRRGQKVALVGSSGSGKSTVLRLIAGDYEPDAGEVVAGGVSTASWSLVDLRRTMAIVDQDAFLFDESIAANVRTGHLDARPEEIEEALDAAESGFVRDLPNGIDMPVGEAGGRISGGQRQRIALARAFMKSAPILILDEATSALDNNLERQVYANMLDRYPDKTILAVAHRLTTVKDSDAIFVFDAGRVVEHGTHDELLAAHGQYATLWNLQQSQEDSHE
jgi:ATP-binding cassette subfamily B protein